MYSTIIAGEDGRTAAGDQRTGRCVRAARTTGIILAMTDLTRTFGCPVELALEVLGGKWKTVLLARLKQGPLRYGDLRRVVPGLSDKVLTQRLRELEEIGLVRRETAAGHERYALTARGESLREVLQSLYDWGRAFAAEADVKLAP
jgi:DNA-binding HxlR family transcriptional regulator